MGEQRYKAVMAVVSRRQICIRVQLSLSAELTSSQRLRWTQPSA